MAKPRPTLTDYIVIALSPVLIIALVGSLCFFLIDVRYQGKMEGALCWVMFWFVIGIVLVSRIAIEQGAERASLFGIGLGGALYLYLIQTSPAYLLALVLMALVWYCAHKLVWDCTLIDDDQDSSGQGLLQKNEAEKEINVRRFWFPLPAFLAGRLGRGVTQKNNDPTKNETGASDLKTLSPLSRGPSRPEGKTAGVRQKPRRRTSESPGRSVLYFSLAALPLFGLGQVLLPADAPGARRLGFTLLVIYLAATLGLLVTTSFLGLRRYLRQRYLPMPASIAFAWVKFGAGVALFILIVAMFLPRPGATVAWGALRVQADQQLRRASQYASRSQPAQPGKGRAADQPGEPAPQNRGSANSPERSVGQSPSAPPPILALSAPAASIYFLLRNTLLVIVALVAGWWLFRCRHLLAEMFRSLLAAIQKALLMSMPKPVRPAGPVFTAPQRRPLSEFKNPFFADHDHSRPPAEIILYTYDALQAWASEQGLEGHPEQTPREFCQSMGTHRPDLSDALHQLAYLHAHAAYGQHLPANCDLEPLKELWRNLTWK